MPDQKFVRRGLLYQRGANVYSHMQKLRWPNACTERFVDTNHGSIRVLEFGFDPSHAAPLYVDLHGGGFVLQTADADRKMNMQLQKKAPVKIISIDYPKAPQHPYPAALEAIYEVVQHYAQHAKQYAITSNRIGIGGHSAGGNLAAAICIRAKERGDLILSYQILDYPVMDLTIDPNKRPQIKGAISPRMITMFDACYIGGNQEVAKSPFVSPVYASKEQLSGLPPALVIVAGRDSLHDEGVQYANMMKDAGVQVELHDFTESLHGFTQFDGVESERAYNLMADFINRNS